MGVVMATGSFKMWLIFLEGHKVIVVKARFILEFY